MGEDFAGLLHIGFGISMASKTQPFQNWEYASMWKCASTSDHHLSLPLTAPRQLVVPDSRGKRIYVVAEHHSS